MIERILLILKTKNISSSQLADEIGVQRSNISHILSGRNKPSLEFVKKILDRYKEINTEWLINGKGPMQKEVVPPSPDLFSVLESKSVKETVFMPVIEEKNLKTETAINETTTPVLEAKQPETKVVTESIPIQMERLPREKDIEKIVIFYTDKTFASYQPE